MLVMRGGAAAFLSISPCHYAQELSESESKRASERDRKAEAETEKRQEIQNAKGENGEQKKKGLSGDIGAAES